MSKYYDKDGKPLELMDWAWKFEDSAYKRIAETRLDNGYWVSTVWMGLNHNFGEGVPLIFETMVFKGSKSDLDCERYTTLQQAEEGHKRMVEKWREAKP